MTESKSTLKRLCALDPGAMAERLYRAQAVVEAARNVDRYAGNPDAVPSFDFACFALHKALTSYDQHAEKSGSKDPK